MLWFNETITVKTEQQLLLVIEQWNYCRLKAPHIHALLSCTYEQVCHILSSVHCGPLLLEVWRWLPQEHDTESVWFLYTLSLGPASASKSPSYEHLVDVLGGVMWTGVDTGSHFVLWHEESKQSVSWNNKGCMLIALSPADTFIQTS